MVGKIEFIQPFVRQGRLRVRVIVKVSSGDYCEAFLPERELAALVPRSLLLPGARSAPSSMLEIIGSILRRMTMGRLVGLFDHSGERFVTFLSWRHVCFRKTGGEKRTTPASEPRKRPQH